METINKNDMDGVQKIVAQPLLRTAVDAKDLPTLKPEIKEPIKEGKFSTLIKNKTDRPVTLRNPPNYIRRNHSTIPPGKSLTIDFEDASYFLAPFDRITYKKNGRVNLRERGDYEAHELKFPSCEFLNANPSAKVEIVMISEGHSLKLPYGIPIKIEVPVFSFYAEFEEVVICAPTAHPVPDIGHPGYTKMEYRANIQYVNRSEKELAEIKKRREQTYLRSVGLG